MLGTELMTTFRALGYDVTGFDVPAWDITRDDDLLGAVAKADIVINSAAYTNVDGAESDPETAILVNGTAVGELGEAAAAEGVRVIHYSTDFVFDGAATDPYTETDAPSPISVYGRSKLIGEEALAASGCDYTIIRLQWTYGTNGINFFTKLLQWAEDQSELKVVDDQVGSPTATTDVARATAELVDADAAGLFHYAAQGYACRSEIAAFTFSQIGLDRTVIPCNSDEFEMIAPRPLSSRFDCSKIDAVLEQPRPTWQSSLADYLETLK